MVDCRVYFYVYFSIGFGVVLVVASYRWSFSSSGLRSCHWAYESACFIHSILSRVCDENELPAVTDVRACLEVEVASLVVSEVKLGALQDEFIVHSSCFDSPDVFEADVATVRSFFLVLVEEVLQIRGMKESVSFHLSVCCPAVLLCGDANVLASEVEQFTELLIDLRRISTSEKRQMDGSFRSFLTNFRRGATDVAVDSCSSAVDILRACDNLHSQRLFRFLMCLGGSPLFPGTLSCVGVGQLRANVTTSVCATILSFLKTHCVRQFESVSGPLVEEVVDAISRFTVLSELTEEMLWDDVGVVADEAYRQSLYELMGFTEEGERAPSPEV